MHGVVSHALTSACGIHPQTGLPHPRQEEEAEEENIPELVLAQVPRSRRMRVGRQDSHLLHWSITRHMLEEFQENVRTQPLHCLHVHLCVCCSSCA